jgi:YgiT-type zinc finger domain-containing protein
MGGRFEDAKEFPMKCTVCGTRMNPITTDLPFKLSEERIVILKHLPLLQCGACREYLIEDTVMARIDKMLARTDSTAELEVLRYAA